MIEGDASEPREVEAKPVSSVATPMSSVDRQSTSAGMDMSKYSYSAASEAPGDDVWKMLVSTGAASCRIFCGWTSMAEVVGTDCFCFSGCVEGAAQAGVVTWERP